MDQLNSGMGKRSSPTAYADDASVVIAREITKAKNINCNIVTGGDPGPSQTGNAAGQFSQADCIALGASVIIVDNISDVDGDVNTSVDTSQVGAGRAAGMMSSSQVPDVVPMEQ